MCIRDMYMGKNTRSSVLKMEDNAGVESEILSPQGVVKKAKTEKILFGTIQLSENTKQKSFWGMVSLFFVIGAVGSVFDTLLTSLLTSKRHNVPFADIGKTLANIGAFELPVLCVMAPIVGVSFDRFGRKPLIFIGTLAVGLIVLVMPYLPNIYPDLIIARSGVAFFAGFSTQAPLVADYFHPNSRGIASGVMNISLMLGGVAGYSVLSIIVKDFPVELVFTTFSGFLFALTIVIIFTIRGGKYHLSEQNDEKEVEAAPNEDQRGLLGVLKDLILGFREARNPWILMAFFAIFLVGVQIPMSVKIFVLWIQSFYDNTDEGKAAGYAKLASINAFSQFGTLIMTVVGSALIDRVSKFAFLVPGAFIQLLGVFIQLVFQDPNSWLMVVSQALQSSGSSILALVQTLIISLYAPVEHRGKVFGAQNSVMSIGAIISGVISGYLFDIQKDIPYLLYGGTAALVTIINLTFMLTQPLWNKKNAAHNILPNENDNEKSQNQDLNRTT
eukprot:TRINITY_DN3418_c0_g1_i2.p1 TRINITY_DN3418_c0_g1~~TRINITY_DN3418_c0_g1_i2.p1  ORF type:complete len:521 (+),score=99.68 TRINITY_DN3418_c0_g1_i2:61-1563(+)